MGEPNDGQSGDPKIKAETVDNVEAVQIEGGDQEQNTNALSDSDITAALNNKLQSILMSACSLPKPVLRNVKALKKIQVSHVNIEVEFYKELHELEMKYEKLFEPLYEKRRQIISGLVIPTDEECEFPESDAEEKETDLSNEIQKVKVDDAEETETDIKGIPEFWLTAFKNAPTIAEMIEEYDEPILKHLTEVKAATLNNPMSFYIEFHFEPNEFFTNTVLTKHYELKCTPDDGDMFSFEGPEIIKSKGCTIDWKKGKNITVKTVKKKQKHKARGAVRTVTKTVPNESFFNFFSPPSPPENEEEELDEDTQNIINNDYEVGNMIKDRIIPHAVLFFTGENMVDDDFDDEEDEDEEDEDFEEESTEDDDENDTQCLNRKKSQGQKGSKEQAAAPPECKQQ